MLKNSKILTIVNDNKSDYVIVYNKNESVSRLTAALSLAIISSVQLP